MVQVENEVGLLGTERDYCRQAEEAFTGNVPDKLMDAAVKSGKIRARETGWPEKADWTVVFGEDAGEIFSAWFFCLRSGEDCISRKKKSILCPATPMCG